MLAQCMHYLSCGMTSKSLTWQDEEQCWTFPEACNLSPLHLYSLSLSPTPPPPPPHPHSAFCTFYCYDGVLRERPFEVLAYVIAVFVIIIYTVGNFGFQVYREKANGGLDDISDDFKLKIVSWMIDKCNSYGFTVWSGSLSLSLSLSSLLVSCLQTSQSTNV